jgi:hypothetical protein
VRWVAREGIKYPMVSGKEGNGAKIMDDFRDPNFPIKHFPTILFIGPDKRILERSIELSKTNILEDILEKHIGPTEIIKNPDFISSHQTVKYMGKSNNSLRISFTKSGVYSLCLYSLEGKEILKPRNNIFFSQGIHIIDFNNSLNNGIFILYSKFSGYVSKEKILVK